MSKTSSRRVVFLSGTRADFGKIKSLIEGLAETGAFDLHVFATGMHMDKRYGLTVNELVKHGHAEVYRYINQSADGRMERSLGQTVLGFGDYVRLIAPDLIVVHGDRVEALAGALVGALNNILVAHIEGGEVSGTVDELIRHAVSKVAHLHFVSNERAQRRLVQLGEHPSTIHVIGSPDLDVMRSANLPSLAEARARYEIPFEQYGILAYHPVTTIGLEANRERTNALISAVESSKRCYVATYPNTDHGGEVILELFRRAFTDHPRVRLIPSLRFEHLLTLLRHADFVIGNSSMGIHEAPFYGIPTINVGSRQEGRSSNPNLIHVEAEESALLEALAKVDALKTTLEPSEEFGRGQSARLFREVLLDASTWSTNVQKVFCDVVPPEGGNGR